VSRGVAPPSGWPGRSTTRCTACTGRSSTSSRSPSLEREVAWLTNVLRSRGFPLDHLARNLDLAASVVDEQLSDAGGAVAERLRAAAGGVPSG
jgi:hypothetical protein